MYYIRTSTRKRKFSTEEEEDDANTSESPPDHHSRDSSLPPPALSTKRISLTAPTSPIFDPYCTTYHQDQQQRRILPQEDEPYSSYHIRRHSTQHFTKQHHYQHQQQFHDPPDHAYQWRSFSDQLSTIPFSPPPQPYDFQSRHKSISQAYYPLPLHPQDQQQEQQTSYQHYYSQQQRHPQQYVYHHNVHPQYYHYPSPKTISSPPSTQFKLDHRHSTTDDKIILPLSPRPSFSSTSGMIHQPSATSQYQDRQRSSSGCITTASTTGYTHQLVHSSTSYTTRQQQPSLACVKTTPTNNNIRLPPLHTMVSNNGTAKEVLSHKKSDVGEVNAAVAMMQLSQHQSMDNTSHLSSEPDACQHTNDDPHYHHLQHEQQEQNTLLDSSRRASIGILNRDSF
ncbi:uncharacterized protein BX664DRAFT_92755 [Halteromyces radiatus]|uniref:uncharacterized protein n=1 Tax=Halteromyces radiatus TaxID=101107 RepID=UPI002220D7E7|nr:uncharacterized protein BX664DRAFT_92755 [Halteromyces radiatus]KAI8092691.1 hypothetical protein BX664DRAFT_92755 [Halteromyces radiatus]